VLNLALKNLDHFASENGHGQWTLQVFWCVHSLFIA
jgi:hypothetical protein